MPIPTPTKSEKDQNKKNEFISRCAGDSLMNKEYPDQKRRLAICFSQWKEAKKRKKSSGSNEDPTWDEQSDKNVTVIY